MDNKETTKSAKRTLQGVVVSDVMDKTVVVRVDQYLKHQKYGKFMKHSKRYKVHDPKNEAKVGDKVTIIECRPYSKDKKFKLVN